MIPITSRRGTRSRITASITDLVVYSATVHRFLFYDIWAEGEKRSSQLNDAQGTGITEIEETFDSDDSTCDSKKVGQKVDMLSHNPGGHTSELCLITEVACPITLRLRPENPSASLTRRSPKITLSLSAMLNWEILCRLWVKQH